MMEKMDEPDKKDGVHHFRGFTQMEIHPKKNPFPPKKKP
jgi:hypothetical protein